MKPSQLSDYYTHQKQGDAHAAGRLAKKGFKTYIFLLAGKRQILHQFIKRPIIAQCNLESLEKCMEDLKLHKKSEEYKSAVETSQENRQVDISQKIWRLNQKISRAKLASLKAEWGQWDDMTTDEQALCEAYDYGHLDRARPADRLSDNDGEATTSIYNPV